MSVVKRLVLVIVEVDAKVEWRFFQVILTVPPGVMTLLVFCAEVSPERERPAERERVVRALCGLVLSVVDGFAPAMVGGCCCRCV